MSEKDLYDYGFGSVWKEIHVNHRAGYSTSVTDYHEHDFYEINLILSGNIRILLGERAEEHHGNCIVLTRPGTPHYIACHPDVLYSRLYLIFTGEFMEDRLPEWHALVPLFGEHGTVIPLTVEQTKRFHALIEQIDREDKLFDKMLLTYYLLSQLSELSGKRDRSANRIPPYILDAIAYLEKHYAGNVLAEDLARHLHIGRTTLMTAFKTHTGRTVGEYLTLCRLRHAVHLLEAGKTLEYAADRCGYADTGGLIRAFRRCYGMTPKEDMKKSDACASDFFSEIFCLAAKCEIMCRKHMMKYSASPNMK